MRSDFSLKTSHPRLSRFELTRSSLDSIQIANCEVVLVPAISDTLHIERLVLALHN